MCGRPDVPVLIAASFEAVRTARRVRALRRRRTGRAAAATPSTRRYSLQWFQALFVAAISKAEKAETLELRLDVLNTFFTYYVYVNVCRCRRSVLKLNLNLI